MPSLTRIFLTTCLALAVFLPGVASAAGPGSTLLVSRPDGTGPPPAALDNDAIGPGGLSDDGRWAVFESTADGLAPGVNKRVGNVFLRDTETGTTTFVSRSDGVDGAPVNAEAEDPAVTVTPAGHVLVAFSTGATNLSDHATGAVTIPARADEVWMRDVTADTTTLVSRS